ncbi:FtsH protease activity modulator HflK [Pelagibacterium flavum]|uniref:Protein HflK n=1 Tax=Pelagibacterium flavum TaxID=2984530 RepID=A0ABY6ISQ6_9HYPH|nr:FtsH protease activity modulator HflK [Pelagibacterium sp. YIM 151497]UYQ73667.1 FtsH protease activity modulator HflK [Pelagibacterium sp. YIM 151497]|tara:strand:+ start:43 stop:1152 length:1110 start_codon:yes stop_codon:yes gene_type:complete|eukprot:jgi/Tetstr1/451141/TSEL_038177.t1
MPWEDNRGGRRSRSGGPWGQAPGGGGGGNGPRRPGGGNNTPNLEDILARGRQQFGGGGNIPGGGRWLAVGVVAAALVFWGSQSIYTIAPNEVGVELLFGQPKDEFSSPGLHFHWWPIERVERASTTENQTRVGTGTSSSSDSGLMLSGDQNIVNMSFSILWRIADPRLYLFEVRDPDEMVRQAAESAMREVVGRRTAQDVFRDDRTGIALEVQQITQTILDSYGVGVTISNISIENVAPPAEVADAFDEVQRALQDEDRFQEEARQYANTLLGSARGQAAAIREEAAAYRDRVINEAEGQAARFVSVYNEYRNAPEVTRQRIFLEMMEEVLGGTEKVLLEGGQGSGVIPYLPLPELRSSGSTLQTGGNQ